MPGDHPVICRFRRVDTRLTGSYGKFGRINDGPPIDVLTQVVQGRGLPQGNASAVRDGWLGRTQLSSYMDCRAARIHPTERTKRPATRGG